MDDGDKALAAERQNLETTRRDEMMIQAVRGLLLANGGGAVALLGFLQAIWNQVDAPVTWIVVALVLMSLGVSSAALVLLIRYQTTVEYQRGNPNWERWRMGYMLSATISLLFFIFGALTVSIGVWTSR